MNPRRVAIDLWPTLVFGSGLVAWFASVGLTENAGTVRGVDRLAPSLAANAVPVAAPKPFTTGNAAAAHNAVTPATNNPVVNSADVAAAELLAEVAVDRTARDKQPSEEPPAVVVATLTDPSEVLAQKPANVPAATAPSEAAAATAAVAPAEDLPRDAGAAASRIEINGECLVAESCIDQFLYALYERTPKLDTIKEYEQRKVSVRNKKGKLVKVNKTFTRLVDNDFTWKDPKAAERSGMSMVDYVIGGMEKGFKLRLFHMLYAAENAGLSPGITSAFRDDYRQSIASGLKAASDRSYHGGSSRGGYGHGLAADIVSTKGATRAQRWVSTEELWKWVDANGKDFGIGRPYLDHDPPHVGPIDGREYVSRRGGTKVASADAKSKVASSDAKKSKAARSDMKSKAADSDARKSKAASSNLKKSKAAADVKKREKQAASKKPAAGKKPHVAKTSKGRTI
jgi:hypothetical protein